MRRKLTCLGGLSVVVAFAFTGVASADVTLGSTTLGATSSNCTPGAVVAQATSDPSTPYTVPAPGGLMTQWQTNTTGATASAPVTLVVLSPAGPGSYTAVGVDSETLPSPLPASHVASFTLSTPIRVTGGETLGLYASGSGAICYSSFGSTPTSDTLTVVAEGSPPATGQTLSTVVQSSAPQFTMNVAATLVQHQDVGVTTSTTPATATVGELALLASWVSNAGPLDGAITFTDTVPAGLTIDAAAAGSGTCATIGQQLTCTITGLAPGHTALVDIVVTPTAAQTYTNRVSVSPAGLTDPNAADNNASASLAVNPTPVPTPTPTKGCIVPQLTGTPLAIAKRVLVLLDCKAGNVHRLHTKKIANDDVIKTVQRPGSYPSGTVVALQVSSGPQKPKHSKHHSVRSTNSRSIR